MGLGVNGITKEVPPRVLSRLDPGPPVPGVNCHIVIDNIGYLFADLISNTQESRQAVGDESLAPMMGNPENMLDTQSSDLTLLLPIGQNDFSAGIGAIDLERTPKGFEFGENLIWTPQNTLINGPVVNSESFTSNTLPLDSRGYQEGYFGGSVSGTGGATNYFGLGNYLYNRSDGSATWIPVANTNNITDISGYSGRVIVGAGDNNGQVFYNNAAYPAFFRIWKSFILNSNPFTIYSDGRIYSSFLDPPNNVSILDQDGADTALAQWAYAATYVIKMPDNSLYSTGLGQLAFATKLPNKELVVSIPVRGYHGGPVLRRLYRSSTNDLNNMYLIADETVLGPNTTRWVDTMTDAVAITKPAYNFTQLNDTGITVLLAGEVNRNMQFPDTHPIWLTQKLVTPTSGDYVTKVVTFHDAQGNEGAAIGTTSGLFIWNGIGLDFQTIRQSFYHPLNFRYMAVNHGVIYYTMMGHTVYMWSPEKTTILQGPWLVHFTNIQEIRLSANSNYVAIAVYGTTKYDANNKVGIVYLYDGEKFVWSHRWIQGSGAGWENVTPVLGGLHNSDTLAMYKGYTYGGISTMSLDPLYTTFQTNNVMFRSASSDGDLPRLRKQIHAVMIRYLRLTAQPRTTLSTNSLAGDTFINVAAPNTFAVGDWISIKDVSLVKTEYRRIMSIAGSALGLQHALGSDLRYPHTIGTTVARCAAVVTLRNVFTDAISTQDIQVGGPTEAGELFAYIKLPQPVYDYSSGIQINYNPGVVMELIGWAMLTSLNPQWQGLMDLNLRLQDYAKLPNNMYDNALASTRQAQLQAAFNKGTVDVIDPLGNPRVMRFQRLNFSYEEPKQRHDNEEHMQATAVIRLMDEMSELSKQSELVLNIKQQ